MPRFNRAYRGLYGNRMVQFGNKISFAENKTRRKWKPNVQIKSMYSETLGRMLRFRMTTYAMRCIRKAGGIDEYLLNTKESEIKYHKALEIKQEILAVRAAQRAAVQRSSDLLSSNNTHLKGGNDASREDSSEGTTHGESIAAPLRSTSPSKQPCRGLQELLWF